MLIGISDALCSLRNSCRNGHPYTHSLRNQLLHRRDQCETKAHFLWTVASPLIQWFSFLKIDLGSRHDEARFDSVCHINAHDFSR